MGKIYFKGNYLTGEQKITLNLPIDRKSLKIEAYAGSGKTFILNAISQLILNKLKGLYISFNSSIVEDSKKVFPENITCKTSHSLAYEAVISGVPNQHKRINKKITSGVVAKYFKITQPVYGIRELAFCGYALEVLKNYLYSVNKNIEMHHTETKTLDPFPEESKNEIKFAAFILVKKIWAEMNKLDSKFPISHDGYLKMWANTDPTIDYDFIMFDESQDANPIILSVLLKQDTQLIFVGDKYQQIYSWRNAINAMESIETENTSVLSESFRFGKAIADLASNIINKGLNQNIKIIGNKKVKSKICQIAVPDIIICRTNATVVEYAIKYLSYGLKVHIKGGVSKLVSLLKASFSLKKGRQVNIPELAIFKNWEELIEYSKTPYGAEFATLVNLVEKHNVYNLIKVLTEMGTNKESNANIILSTAHKVKGCEFPKVMLANDFKLEDDKYYSEEEVRLLYVAVTRASQELDISECSAAKYYML
jgi:hypothetical protein